MKSPSELLRIWIEEAGGEARLEAIAMCLATSGPQGRPSNRLVLMRGLDDRGLRFYTSYGSRKARDLEANPAAAATFYWPWLQRQVRVEGEAKQLAESESDAYFAARPRGHQLAAWASEQSAEIESHALLAERYDHFEQRFDGQEVPRPHSWGGYLLAPGYFEFWQGRPNRMHERTAFERSGNDWRRLLLQP